VLEPALEQALEQGLARRVSLFRGLALESALE
jgi:hypothetical protein